jgi:hypothetical protein
MLQSGDLRDRALLSTGFTPVGATTDSYQRISYHLYRFPPGLSRWEQQLTATSASLTTPIAFHRVYPGGSNN